MAGRGRVELFDEETGRIRAAGLLPASALLQDAGH